MGDSHPFKINTLKETYKMKNPGNPGLNKSLDKKKPSHGDL